jgi:hypothetical protein
MRRDAKHLSLKIKVMLNLSIQDQFDGLGKVEQLRSVVGLYYLSTKLISVSDDGNECVIEEHGKTKRQPSAITWNRFFF